MKLSEIFEGVDIGDHYLQDTVANQQAQQQQSPMRGVWLIDRKTGKKVGGPFKDDDAAASFKKNRPDRIPADARIVRL
jgi:hypothetical protein